MRGAAEIITALEIEPEQHIYDRGDTGFLVIRNFTSRYVAVGGCNPSYYEERGTGEWLPDNLIRLACAFYTRLDGSHELDHYEIIRPKSILRVSFPTGWISESEGVIRVRQRVSVDCQPPKANAPLHCAGVSNLVSDPILIVEPGTAEEVAPPEIR